MRLGPAKIEGTYTMQNKGEMFKCCNCGFVCEIINSKSLDMGIAECEKCGMKGLRRQNPNVSFVDSFREVITMFDPQANSLMSKDMPPSVKILADWGRKACNEIDTLRAELDDCQNNRG